MEPLMKKLVIPNVEAPIPAIQQALRRPVDAGHARRPSALLLVAQGRSCPKVAEFFDIPVRTVQHWVRRVRLEGLDALIAEKSSGRPRKLSPDQLSHIMVVLRHDPSVLGLCGRWDGKMLSWYIKKEFGVDISVRHCQKMFHELGFRFRKPRPVIASGDDFKRSKFKKNASYDDVQ